MVALRGTRPFSLDAKLERLDDYLPRGRKPCEIRLLAVEARYRNTAVFVGLVMRLVSLARSAGYDLALISGTVRQLKLYRHIGFDPFGPLVGSSEARYQPMLLTLESLRNHAARLLAAGEHAPEHFSFLTGPVQVSASVRKEFTAEAASHRAESFTRVLTDLRLRLCELASAPHAAVLLGSGTLANDVVAAQLCQRHGKGLVLSNGEFGERLVDHAVRSRLDFDVYRCAWAQPFDLSEIARRLRARPSWLWLAHCETSTGMLNELDAVSALCRAHGTELCVDAISSIGTVPVNLREVAFATAVSGKGLGSYPGLAVVFHRQAPAPSPTCPRYLDLALYCGDEVPFTQSSNLVSSLAAALRDLGPASYDTVARDCALLRRQLEEAGLQCLVPAQRASPAVLTLALDDRVSSAEVGRHVAAAGYLIGYNSAYLLHRNWIQIALMGEYNASAFPELVDSLRRAINGGARGGSRRRAA
jgi:aspartate aminotransferase-like enzyme